MRLWSWASGKGTARQPSHIAINEHSGPLIRSSRTNEPSAASSIATSVSARSAGTVTPLPAARPVALDDDRGAQPVEPRHRRIGLAGGEAGEARAGDAEVGGESAGVALRSFQPGELGRRPEARHATTGALVGDAGDQRGLGTRDDEIGLGLVGPRQLVGDGHLVAVLPARPGDRPLASPAAEHQDVHRRPPPPAPERFPQAKSSDDARFRAPKSRGHARAEIRAKSSRRTKMLVEIFFLPHARTRSKASLAAGFTTGMG